MKRLSMVLGVGAMALTILGCGTAEEEDAVESGEPVKAPLIAGGSANNEYYFTGQVLWSAGCTHRAVMQGDGNFVVYNRNGTAIWNAGTVGHSGAWAVLQGDGNFVIYPRDGGSALFSTGTFSGQRLSMQNDGNLVLYSFTVNPFGTAVWSSGTHNVLSSNCATPRASEVTFVQGNMDRPGSDLGGMPLALSSAGACGNACAANSACLAYSFAPTGCWLKGAVPPTVSHTGITSGVKRRLCNGASSC